MMSLYMTVQSGKFKEFLSHVYEFPIEQVESRYSTLLNISYYKGRYLLSTRNAVYSFADKYSSFLQAFKKIDLKNRNIQKVLLLGYGLGSIPQILQQHYQFKGHFTAVEIDPVIIDLAKRYGYMPEQSKIDVYCADAYDFVKSDKEQYDLICADIFIDDTIPESIESDAFLHNLSRLLHPKNGLLLYSRLQSDDFQRSATQAFKNNHFKKIFYPIVEIDTKGNLILLYDAGC